MSPTALKSPFSEVATYLHSKLRNSPSSADECDTRLCTYSTSVCTGKLRHQSEVTISKTQFWLTGDIELNSYLEKAWEMMEEVLY